MHTTGATAGSMSQTPNPPPPCQIFDGGVCFNLGVKGAAKCFLANGINRTKIHLLHLLYTPNALFVLDKRTMHEKQEANLHRT